MDLTPQFYELIKKASTDLAPDVEKALQEALEREEEGGSAKNVFASILENVRAAREAGTPICQDTGTLIFYIDHPHSARSDALKEMAEAAAVQATREYILRPNAVDPVTGKNSGNNIGRNVPYFHFHQWDEDHIRVRLMLKGGGSENVGIQYKLPDASLGAGRDLMGVRKLVVDAVTRAQGFGCAPGIIGVGIGGDRITSFMLSKELFFRRLGSQNEDPALNDLENELYENLNKLGIGPMGFGGKTTVLGVYIGAQHRHPATYFVSISYMCWAYRRKMMTVKGSEVTYAD